jgi:hypothetical protein
MKFDRKQILSDYPWLAERKHRFIISADYDGIICASLLHHILGWKLEGYYNLQSIWVSDEAMKHRDDIIWVDLNILPKQGRAIGGHIVSIQNELPDGFQTSCNPNILAGLSSKDFHSKFPFSTLIYLMWLHNIPVRNELFARLLVLHADATWLKMQHYPKNFNVWKSRLTDYSWKHLFQRVNTSLFDKRIDQLLYTKLKELGVYTKKGKLTSTFSKIKSVQYQCNPDWDEDVIIALFHLIGNHLKWTPPSLPKITKRIDGVRNKVPLSEVKSIGLNVFIRTRKVFSYAIPSPRILNYTSFGYVKKSPMKDTHAKP